MNLRFREAKEHAWIPAPKPLTALIFLPLTSFPGKWKNNSEMTGLGTHDPFFLLKAQAEGVKWASVLVITVLPPQAQEKLNSRH